LWDIDDEHKVGLIVVKGTLPWVWDRQNMDGTTPIISIGLSYLFLKCFAISAYGLQEVVLEYHVVGWVFKWDGLGCETRNKGCLR
jgi:hypothetical protein